MSLEIETFTLGPMENNTFLVYNPETNQAAVVDPTFDSQKVAEEIFNREIDLTQIWLTHAHFDHVAGVKLFSQFSENVAIYLHPDDLDLYQSGGGAAAFGLQMPVLPEPNHWFEHHQKLALGSEILEIRHTPGHTPGSVTIYSPSAQAALVGDLIFYEGVGRTDLEGGSSTKLMRSIYTQIFNLPGETRLLSGHGPESSVAHEQQFNPFAR
jgi:hydroxyacylglutathione hydrolase